MTHEPTYLLKPVFDFLDGVIRDQGNRLFVVFAYICFAVIAWILSGGMRRRFNRRVPDTPTTVIVIVRPASQQLLPPIIGQHGRLYQPMKMAAMGLQPRSQSLHRAAPASRDLRAMRASTSADHPPALQSKPIGAAKR
jgi:hypothetical protein